MKLFEKADGTYTLAAHFIQGVHKAYIPRDKAIEILRKNSTDFVNRVEGASLIAGNSPVKSGTTYEVLAASNWGYTAKEAQAINKARGVDETDTDNSMFASKGNKLDADVPSTGGVPSPSGTGEGLELFVKEGS